MNSKCYCPQCPGKNCFSTTTGSQLNDGLQSSSNSSSWASSSSDLSSTTDSSSSHSKTQPSTTMVSGFPPTTTLGQPSNTHYATGAAKGTDGSMSISTTRTAGSTTSSEMPASKYAKELLRAAKLAKQKRRSDATLNTYCDSVLVGDWDTKSRAYEIIEKINESRPERNYKLCHTVIRSISNNVWLVWALMDEKWDLFHKIRIVL